MNSVVLDTDFLSLLPPWYREVLDYQQICQSEQEQWEALAAEISAIADNFFCQTMDVGAVSQWEQILGIVPNPITETLSFRRARILNRISTRPPFTMRFLYQKLDELIGPGEWTVNMDYPNYTLYIESSAQDQSYATELAFTIGQIKPAHIVYVNSPSTQATILLGEEIAFSRRKFHYRLGSWALGVHPFSTGTIEYNYQLGSWLLGTAPFATEPDMEVIKTVSEPSIQQPLFLDAVQAVYNSIASAQVNGETDIASVVKAVANDSVVVTYTVPAGIEITSVALLDSEGNILTEAQVYIPAGDNTVMKHIAYVSEGGNTNGQ